MSWQVLHAPAQIQEASHPRMVKVETGLVEMPLWRVFRVFPLPGAHQAGQTSDTLLVKAKHLAHFPGGRPPAVGDHIGRHGRPQLAVTLVDILNDALPLVPAGQI